MDSVTTNIDVLTPSDLGYDLDVPVLADFFREAYDRNVQPLVLKGWDITHDATLGDKIVLGPFRGDVNLYKETSNTINGHSSFFLFKTVNVGILSIAVDNVKNMVEVDTFDSFMGINEAIEEVYIDSFNDYFGDSLELYFDLSENDEYIETKIQSDVINFTPHLCSSDYSSMISFMYSTFHWSLLIESEEDKRKIGAIANFNRKLKFVNSQDAIDQTVDRKLYLEKAIKEFQENF